MDLQKFLAKKQSCEVAMQRALQEWQRHPVELKCPVCGSSQLATRPGLKGKNPLWCTCCHHYFDQPTDFVCDCSAPGGTSKCHDCPNFHRLLVTVKAKAAKLNSHDLQGDRVVPD
jgi:hypothetical protein